MTHCIHRARAAGAARHWVIGCLSVLGVFVLAAIIGGFLIVRNIRSIGANFAHTAMVQMVNDSQLPADQKQKVIVHLDRLSADFKAGKITMEDLGRVMEQLAESPLLTVGMVYMAEEKYIKPSDLTPEEKQDARLQLERVARGVYEKKVPEWALDEITAPIMVTDAQGNERLKETITREELEQLIAGARQKADEANIPHETFKVDVADELGKAIDRALNPAAPPVEAVEQAPPAGGLEG